MHQTCWGVRMFKGQCILVHVNCPTFILTAVKTKTCLTCYHVKILLFFSLPDWLQEVKGLPPDFEDKPGSELNTQKSNHNKTKTNLEIYFLMCTDTCICPPTTE